MNIKKPKIYLKKVLDIIERALRGVKVPPP
jgi:formyltetrahydrofolate synthetase